MSFDLYMPMVDENDVDLIRINDKNVNKFQN